MSKNVRANIETLQILTLTFTLMGNLKWPGDLIYVSMGCGKKLEYPEEPSSQKGPSHLDIVFIFIFIMYICILDLCSAIGHMTKAIYCKYVTEKESVYISSIEK